MALDLHNLIDLGTALLDWCTDTPEGQGRMAADLKLLAELHCDTLPADQDCLSVD